VSEQDKLRLGIEAAREGDKEVARDLLGQVVEEDETNVQAWIWLSRIVDDVDEKRIYLTTILQLDPGNDYAQGALDKLEAKVSKKRNNDEFVPGITRQQVRLTIIGFAVFAFVMCGGSAGIATLILNSASNQRAEATAIALEATGLLETQAANQTATRIVEETAEADAAATAAATITPPTNTPDLTRNPATWTPSPTPTEFVEEVLPPPPGTLPGTITVWGGRDIFSNDFLELRIYRASAGGNFTNPDQNLRVRYPTVDQMGQRLVYMRYFQRTNNWTLHSVPLGEPASPGESLNNIWGGSSIVDARNASLSADGMIMAFIGRDVATGIEDIYFVDLSTEQFLRVTTDEANYDFPTISPDGNTIAAIQDTGDGPDLIQVDISDPEAGFRVEKLTNDFGAFVETSPSWKPNGLEIIYSVAPGTETQNHDIYSYLVQTGQSIPLITTNANDLYPFYSSDGVYVAYSSNPTVEGHYNVYIYSTEDATTWQLTNDPFDEFVSGWGGS